MIRLWSSGGCVMRSILGTGSTYRLPVLHRPAANWPR